MTTLDNAVKTCARCGHEKTYIVIGSTNSFGSPDLDLRPPEMQRSTMAYWVETCPECGYCNYDIEEAADGVDEVVDSDAYRQQLRSAEYPELANAFLCYAMIEEHFGDYSAAGHTTMSAAWTCDDAGLEREARQCREQAIRLLRLARQHDQIDEDPPGAAEALLADLMRRSDQFDLARQTCAEGLDRNPDELITSVLRFQGTLIDRQDTGVYTVDDAVEDVAENENQGSG